jgi:hypothetical protein
MPPTRPSSEYKASDPNQLLLSVRRPERGEEKRRKQMIELSNHMLRYQEYLLILPLLMLLIL